MRSGSNLFASLFVPSSCLTEVGRECAGDGEARAVAGQVQYLLAEAQDPANLAAIYVGWAPWFASDRLSLKL